MTSSFSLYVVRVKGLLRLLLGVKSKIKNIELLGKIKTESPESNRKIRRSNTSNECLNALL